MSDWPGQEYYDYYESVTAVCRWPGCRWEGATYWDENEHAPAICGAFSSRSRTPDTEKPPVHASTRGIRVGMNWGQ